MHTRPACSPRFAMISFTRSSFRKFPFADELDFDTSLRRHLLRVLANPVPVRLGELRIVEDPNLPLKQQRRHSPGKTDTRQGAENQHAVKATQHPFNLSGVSLG